MIPAVDIFARPDWQMSPGERAALEGLVSQLRPRLAIEIGTAEGGSLQRIAAHSVEVHAIDLTGHESLGRGAALVAAPSAPPSGAARLPLDAEHVGREQLRRELEAIKSSASWLITAPLSWAKARVGGLRAGKRR